MGGQRGPEARVSIVAPALDAAMNVYFVLRQLPEVHEVVVVDCGSTDGTPDVARHARTGVRVLEQPGADRAAALAAGIAAATGDIIVTLPVDGSADPLEIPAFVEALLAGADLVKGSRYLAGGSVLAAAPGEALGDRVLSWLGRRLTGADVTDLGHGFYAFWADQRDRLRLPPGAAAWRGQVDVAVAVRLAEAGAVVAEVPCTQQAPLVGSAVPRGPEGVLHGMRTLLAEHRRSRRGRGSAGEPAAVLAGERSLA